MKNLTILYPNLARAYEIALLGKHSITVVYSGELYDYPKASEDYQIIKEFYDNIDFTADGDIWVEITKPSVCDSREQGETLADINWRVRVVQARKNPSPNESLDSSGKELLKTAVERLNLSLKDVKIIKELANTIAKLEGEDFIKPQHLAEAIGYRNSGREDQVNLVAENDTIHFGNKIKIKRGGIYHKDAKKAINYLKKML